MTDISETLRSTTEEMANFSSQDFDLWNRHSNAALQAVDEIKRLRRELFEAMNQSEGRLIALKKEARQAADTIEALRAENARLKKALKPFADKAEYFDNYIGSEAIGILVTVEWLRAARAAMGETE